MGWIFTLSRIIFVYQSVWFFIFSNLLASNLPDTHFGFSKTILSMQHHKNICFSFRSSIVSSPTLRSTIHSKSVFCLVWSRNVDIFLHEHPTHSSFLSYARVSPYLGCVDWLVTTFLSSIIGQFISSCTNNSVCTNNLP